MKIKQDTERWLKTNNIEFAGICYYDFGFEKFCKISIGNRDLNTKLYQILPQAELRVYEKGEEAIIDGETYVDTKVITHPFYLQEIYAKKIRASCVRVVALPHECNCVEFVVYDNYEFIKWLNVHWTLGEGEDGSEFWKKYGAYGRSI